MEHTMGIAGTEAGNQTGGTHTVCVQCDAKAGYQRNGNNVLIIKDKKKKKKEN